MLYPRGNEVHIARSVGFEFTVDSQVYFPLDYDANLGSMRMLRQYNIFFKFHKNYLMLFSL